MKKMTTTKAALMVIAAAITVLSVIQCTKVGDVVSGLDRSLQGVPDSAVFASYYDTTVINNSDPTKADVNDVIRVRGVQTIIKEYCGTSNCHGGPINPKIFTYNDIMQYVTPGNPEGSKLWEYLTTNNFDKAMPPVSSNHEMSTTDKVTIYNWIRNGAKVQPDLKDFRPAAIRLIVDGCGSANCHNQATATGGWARKGLLGTLTTSDTSQYFYINPGTGLTTIYCQLSNATMRNQVWGAYKDSVKKFYADTVANASFRPYKILGTPVSALSTRGPLNTYDDIILDALYPKSVRSNSSVVYTDGSGNKYYVRGDYLNATSSLVTRIDSTLLLANPRTGVYATTQQGDMAYGDGGLKGSEIALIKAWYFADPNIPDVWKYGQNNVGIFKYRKTGNIITKK
ncbi:MAG: hypothetical protein U0V75_00520 [Ferruginibacter sp.]